MCDGGLQPQTDDQILLSPSPRCCDDNEAIERDDEANALPPLACSFVCMHCQRIISARLRPRRRGRSIVPSIAHLFVGAQPA